MEQIYNRLLELIEAKQEPTDAKELEIYNQLKKIRWIDMDKGQLEFYETRPAVAFPCALIKIEIAKTENLGSNVQRCFGRGTIRLAFDYVGETAAKTPTALRQQSLEYFDILQAVYLAVQGKTGGAGKFDRQSAVEENRPDGLKVLNMPFATNWIDKSAS
ncbi:Uncharacterised protein [Sphingobacterium spiritivorum]|uniref:Uncharacterized protein n=1 Tax=Sphingobacterium spiritivorum TaxID=258 RepID=A0A380CSC1_SPHSI|nr:hypothetical protein [Sphingobacterium spiritivorum]SUJ26433.1 Uncharacterised protein [Sphingobacterium spiritivorum]